MSRVNEILNDDEAGSFRETIWYQAYEDVGLPGEQYVADVFRWALEADPQALLFDMHSNPKPQYEVLRAAI